MVDIEWLVVDGSEQIGRGTPDAALRATHQQDGHSAKRFVTANSLRQLKAVHAWHHEVGNDQRGTLAIEDLQCTLAIASRHGHVAFVFKSVTKDVGDEILIVDDQDSGHVSSTPATSRIRYRGGAT
ncbi:hypothetical protein ABMD26_000654 [Pseudomonas sp. PvP001]